MNAKKCKALRAAAGLKGHATEYYPPEIHHFVALPTYKTHERRIRSMGARGLKTLTTITKPLFTSDGRLPLLPILDAKGKPVTELVPIAKPYHIKNGSPRAVYHALKVLERRRGLDNVYDEMYREATA
jgi:hypothetical protein